MNAQKETVILGSRIRGSYEHRRDRGDEAVGRLPWGKKYHRILSQDGPVEMSASNHSGCHDVFMYQIDTTRKLEAGINMHLLSMRS